MRRNKLAFFLILIFILPFTIFAVSAFAEVNPAVEVPYNQPGLKVCYLSGNSNNIDEVYVTKRDYSIDATVSLFNNNGTYYLITVSLSSSNLFDMRGYDSISGTQKQYLGYYTNKSYAYCGTTYYYYDYAMFNGTVSQTLIPTFTSLNDAIESCIENLNYTPPPPTYDYTFDIPAGNIAFIELSEQASDHVSLRATMPDLSTLWVTGEQPVFWEKSYANYGYSNTLPTPGQNLQSINFTNIPWQRGSDRNTFEQTKTAVYSVYPAIHNFSKYYVVNNPAYYDPLTSNMSLAPTIYVTATDVISVTVYSMTADENGYLVRSIYWERTPEGEWVASDGGDSTPIIGGGNYVPNDSDINGILDNLVADIDNIFQSTIKHIERLSSTCQSFFEYIRNLFSWLPEEVQSILISCMIVSIAVGIIKALL